MLQMPSIAAYIKADSQNDENIQYRVIVRYINEILPGTTCFFFCDYGSANQVEFNRLMYLASKRKFTHIVTCTRDNLPSNITSLLLKTEITLAIVRDNSLIRIVHNKE